MRVDETGKLFYYFDGETAPSAPATRPADVATWQPAGTKPADGLAIYVHRIQHDDMTNTDIEVYRTLDTEGLAAADFATTLVMPPADKANTEQVYLVDRTGDTPTYTKVDLYTDEAGTLSYAPSGSSTLTEAPADAEFARFDSSLVHDNHRLVPPGQLLAEQANNTIYLYTDDDNDGVYDEGEFKPVTVMQANESRDEQNNVVRPSQLVYYLAGDGFNNASDAEKATAKWMLRNQNFDIILQFSRSDDIYDVDETTLISPAVEKGHVISCTVTTPATATTKAVVTVVVSLGPTEVYDPIAELIGKTEAEATTALDALGYDISEVTRPFSDKPAGTVLKITTEIGAVTDSEGNVTSRGRVTMEVSAGPDRFEEFRGFDRLETFNKLVAAGYDVEVALQYDDTGLYKTDDVMDIIYLSDTLRYARHRRGRYRRGRRRRRRRRRRYWRQRRRRRRRRRERRARDGAPQRQGAPGRLPGQEPQGHRGRLLRVAHRHLRCREEDAGGCRLHRGGRERIRGAFGHRGRGQRHQRAPRGRVRP